MEHRYLEAGKIVSTHGVRGEFKVLPWADGPEFLLKFKTFYLMEPAPRGQAGTAPALPDAERGGTRRLPVETSRVQKTCVLLKIKDIDTVEQAQTLRDKVLYIARDDPHIPAGTVFQADLIGLPVRAGGEEIGTIREILSMPASEVWVVRGAHEYMIPNVKAFVPRVDPALGYVEVNLIEGMRSDAD